MGPAHQTRLVGDRCYMREKRVAKREGVRSYRSWSARLQLVLALGVLVGVMSAVYCTPVLALAVEESVTDVASSSASLQACIPVESPETSYSFEYGTGIPYTSTVKATESSAGACLSGLRSVEAHIQRLLTHTLYYYRVVAGTVDGTGQTFTTQPAGGGGLTLPDGRVWELVSPARKDGALIQPIEEGAGLVQAAESGDAITYTSNGPAESNPVGNADETQILSVRHPAGGWGSQDIATPHKVVAGVSLGVGQEYRAFSTGLSVGLVQPFGLGYNIEEAEGAVPLSEAASEATPYLRADAPLMPEPGASEQAAYHEAAGEGGYLPLITNCPPASEKCKPRVEERANAPAGVKFGGGIEFLGANATLSHVVLRSKVPLIATAEENDIYEWTADNSPREQLQLISVLPEGPPYEGRQAPDAELGDASEKDARDAISSDGSRVIWSYEGHLFMRYTLNGQTWQTVQIDAGGSEGTGRAEFQFADSDGSKIFFTDEERLSKAAQAEERKPELYECDMVEEANRLKCDLRDLTVADDKGSESADVQGVVLAGSNSSPYLYLVAKGVLTSKTQTNAQGEFAKVEADNLYMLHYYGQTGEWKPTFIAVLSEEDNRDWAKGGGNLEKTTSRVSPDGEYLAFMSELDLTSYHNLDVNSGQPDEEVYLYRVPSVEIPAGRLVCVSCNPTGERPAGVQDSEEANGGLGLLVDQQLIWSGANRWLAGSVPGWTGMAVGKADYQSRYLLNSGRVFFDSSDALVPQATNGLVDVYEYEPEGMPEGGPYMCTQSSSAFSAAAGGCIGLISSGSSSEESVFLDASESGNDLFFLTSAPLVAADHDTAFDVYDAHACSESAACSSEAVSPPVCVTAEACRVSPTPQPSVFGAAASATFSGAGNLVIPPVSTIKCSKGKKLSNDRCVKVKGKGAKSKKGKRKDRKAGSKIRRAGGTLGVDR